MEILAQWLDDLDDAVLCIPLAWERIRCACLNVGLTAALVVPASSVFGAPGGVAPAFASVAVGSVTIWLGGLLSAGLVGLPRRHRHA
jgi:hypothetical protein